MAKTTRQPERDIWADIAVNQARLEALTANVAELKQASVLVLAEVTALRLSVVQLPSITALKAVEESVSSQVKAISERVTALETNKSMVVGGWKAIAVLISIVTVLSGGLNWFLQALFKTKP